MRLVLVCLMLSLSVIGIFLASRGLPRKQPTVRNTPSLSKPPREFRFAVLGRPAELPLKALARMPEVQDLPLRFIPCQTPAQRWLMLASGQADVALASSDELALALPRFQQELHLVPVARNQGNEQVVMSKSPGTPPLVGYLPGGVSQSLVLNLKDPSLQPVPLETPEQALKLLQAGQIRGCSLWNPWLQRAQQGSIETRGGPSNSLEVWVWSEQSVELGRLSHEDGLKALRAWFDLMRQLAEQPELTRKAISDENEVALDQVAATLSGLQFYSAGALMGSSNQVADELTTQMKDKVNLLALAGQPVGGDIGRLKVDLEWLSEVGLSDSPVEPAESPTPQPGPEGPSPTATPPGDPFAHASPGEVPPPAVAMAGGDEGRSGRLPGPALKFEPKQLWRTALGSEPTTPAIGSVEGDQIFVGCADGNLACVDASGRLVWRQSLGDRVRSAPVCGPQWVVAAADNGQILSFDRATGTRRWAVQASSDVVGPLAFSQGSLLATSLDGEILCLEAASGLERWRVPTATNITTGVAISGDSVVVAGLDQKVRALSLSDGSTQWTRALGGPCRSTPCIDSGLVVLGCGDRHVYGLRLKDGSQAWKRKLADEVACAPLSLGRNVYVGCKDNKVYGLNRGSGDILWNYPTRERIQNDLVGSGDTLYAVSQDMRLYALEASSGKLLFKHKQSSWLQTPWLQQQVLYLPCADGHLVALK